MSKKAEEIIQKQELNLQNSKINSLVRLSAVK